MEGHEQAWEKGADINGDKKDGNHHNGQISSQFLTPERILGFTYEHEIIHVKVHAEQQHEYGNDPLLVHGIIGLA